MILKASQRSGAKQLGIHLLKTEENEHVEIHEISGFVSNNLMGAMKEAQALSLGTKCKQHLFSVSLNPPAKEQVRAEVFEYACSLIEERMGLKGQPRIVVFHEKEGRRHAHAVWSRIDAQTMTARPLPFFKTKLREVSRQLYLENGWKMPQGLADSRLRDPRSFTLAEWQQAKRAGIDAKQIKQTIQECWAVSDNATTFAKALESRGLFLAKGDRRGHVAVSMEGEAFSIARMTGLRTKEIRAKLGQPDDLRSVSETTRHIGAAVTPMLSQHIAEAKRMAANALKPLHDQRQAMTRQHQAERDRLDRMQQERRDAEKIVRAARLHQGLRGIWDRLTRRHARVQKQNEMEAFFALNRDRAQRDNLIFAQIQDRQTLQHKIMRIRGHHAEQLLGLYRDASRYRSMARGDKQSLEHKGDVDASRRMSPPRSRGPEPER